MMKRLITGCLAALAIAVAAPAVAQGDYPQQPIRMVVGLAAGGGSDLIARTLADRMSGILGQQVVVENRPGAAGLVAAAYVANARPDGYTIYFHGNSTIIAAELSENPGFDTLTSFDPVANINRTPFALIAAPDFPADTVDEFVELARAAPGEYFYGLPGVGSSFHLVMEVLQAEAGIELEYAAYQGAAPTITALMAGEIPTGIVSLAGAAEQWRAGNIKILGVLAPERLEDFAELPLVSETLQDFEMLPGNWMEVPAGTPEEIVTTLSDAIGEVLELPDIQNFFRQQGLIIDYRSAAEMVELKQQEVQLWTEATQSVDISE